MAKIDVSELLGDSDFLDSIKLVRRKACVNDKGINVVTETEFATVGTIQPASGKTLQRLPEALRVADVSSFWIIGKLEVDDCDKAYPSVIIFNCERYTIQTVLDYSNWGRGYSEGTCVREKPAG